MSESGSGHDTRNRTGHDTHNRKGHDTRNRKGHDLMSINHFLIYFGLGILIPHNYVLCIVLSIAWEVFEYALTKHPVAYKLTKNHWPIPEYYWNENNHNRVADIVFNIIGYVAGSLIQSRI